MANRQHLLRHLIHVDANAAKRQILDALRETKTHKADAAKLLGCTHGTFLQWIKQLGIGADVAMLVDTAKAEGWHHGRGGGPHKPRGVRSWEVVTRSGERVCTYATEEAANGKVASSPRSGWSVRMIARPELEKARAAWKERHAKARSQRSTAA